MAGARRRRDPSVCDAPPAPAAVRAVQLLARLTIACAPPTHSSQKLGGQPVHASQAPR